MWAYVCASCGGGRDKAGSCALQGAGSGTSVPGTNCGLHHGARVAHIKAVGSEKKGPLLFTGSVAAPFAPLTGRSPIPAAIITRPLPYGTGKQYSPIQTCAHAYTRYFFAPGPTLPLCPRCSPGPTPTHPAPCLQEPASAELSEVFERMKDLGVLMGKGGLAGNVFRIKPPMCFSMADADFLVDVMDYAMDRL